MKVGGIASSQADVLLTLKVGNLKKKLFSVKRSFTEKCLFRSKFIGETKTRCAQLLSFGNEGINK